VSFWDILIETIREWRKINAHFLILDKEATKDPMYFDRMKNSTKRLGNLLKLMLGSTAAAFCHWINKVLLLK